jgi:hypothetical protein
MPAAADILDRGRESYGRHAWADAFATLSAADRAAPLGPDDLVCLATAAYLVGRDDESTGLWARAHHDFLGRGDVEPAARCAFWLAFLLKTIARHMSNIFCKLGVSSRAAATAYAYEHDLVQP